MQRNTFEKAEVTVNEWVKGGFLEIFKQEEKETKTSSARERKRKRKEQNQRKIAFEKLKILCVTENLKEELFEGLNNALYPLVDAFINPQLTLLKNSIPDAKFKEEFIYLAKIQLAKLIINKMEQEKCVDGDWIKRVGERLENDFNRIRPIHIHQGSKFLFYLACITGGLQLYTAIDTSYLFWKWYEKGTDYEHDLQINRILNLAIRTIICLGAAKYYKPSTQEFKLPQVAKSPRFFKEFKGNVESDNLSRNTLSLTS